MNRPVKSFISVHCRLGIIFLLLIMLLSFFNKDKVEAGCDEAGRGCLAGPVVAAAVILPKTFRHRTLNDSKQLTEPERLKLRKTIVKRSLAYGVGVASPGEIDEINILNASYLAMHRALDNLKIKPELLLIDGNRYKAHDDTPYECIVKGDSKYYAIAAASVLAKTYRDDLMRQLALEFPDYGWETNVGYPTIKHRDGIRSNGVTPHHRMSFQLLPAQLELF